MPGWYYWIIPFFIYFYTKNTKASRLTYYLLIVAYFVYFAFSPTSDYLYLLSGFWPSLATFPNLYTVLTHAGIDAQAMSNLSLTLLQAVLGINVLWIYHQGVAESKKSKLCI